MRKIASENKPKIVSGLRRYLYYNYDISEMIEKSVEQSLKNIENIKMNYHDMEPKEGAKEKFVSIFKKIIRAPEKDKEPMLKFSQVKKIPLKMQPVIEKIQKKTPFEKLMLLRLDKETLEQFESVSAEEFKTKQNEIYRRETEAQAASFIVEFNELIMKIGKESF